MKIFVKVLALYHFLLLMNEIKADGVDTNKGAYSYMAYLYYADKTVLHQKVRFFQNAILVQPNALISASLEIGNDSFPIKTLVARAGAVTVDEELTLNEDEDEQEREIIQVIQPFNHNPLNRWGTDICLMKTLLPFNITVVVKPIKLDYAEIDATDEKNCKILAFVKKNPDSDARSLVDISMELSTSNCENFDRDTMICGTEENKNFTSFNDFCLDNSGGPLICNDKIVGLQTYVDGKPCEPPRLFQLISSWSKFINCAYLKCHDECDEQCKIVPKDVPLEETTLASTSVEESYEIKFTSTKEATKEEVPFVYSANKDPISTMFDKAADIHEKYVNEDEPMTKKTPKPTEYLATVSSVDKAVEYTIVNFTEGTEATSTPETENPANATVADADTRRKDARKMGRNNAEHIDVVAQILLSPIFLKFLV